MGSDDMKDVKIVMELIEDFISNLTASLDTFSSYYRVLLRNIAKLVAEKFNEKELERSVVCAFFFLRLICPALVTPSRFEVPIKKVGGPFYNSLPVEAMRSLVVVSKVLQAIGNGIGIDDSKEQWMLTFSSFVKYKTGKVGNIFERLLQDEVVQVLPPSKDSEVKLPEKCLNYIHERMNSEHSLQGHVYDVMRTLPSISKSHPITWTPFEIHVWLRSKGMENIIPTFVSCNAYGAEILQIDREKVRDYFGIPHYSQQYKLVKAIDELLFESSQYLPTNYKNLSIATTWHPEELVEWLIEIGATELIPSISHLNIDGAQFFNLTIDQLCLLGAPCLDITPLLQNIRNVITAFYYLDLQKYYSSHKLPSTMKEDSPSEFDNALESWLESLALYHSSSTPNNLDSEIIEDISDKFIFNVGKYNFGLLNVKRGTSKWKLKWIILDTIQGTLFEVKRSKLSPSSTYEQINSVKPDHKIFVNESIVQGINFIVDKPHCISISDNKQVIYLEAMTRCISRRWTSMLLEHTTIVVLENLNIQIFTIAVIVVSKKTAKIIEINGAAQILFGCKSKDILVKKPIKSILPNLENINQPSTQDFKTSLITQSGKTISVIGRIGIFREKNEERVLISLRPHRMRSISNLDGVNNHSLRISRSYSLDKTVEPAQPVGFLALLEEDNNVGVKTVKSYNVSAPALPTQRVATH